MGGPQTQTHTYSKRDVTESHHRPRGRVDYAVHDLDLVRYYEPAFDALPDVAKLAVLDDYAAESTLQRASQPNTTCVGLDEARVISMDWTDGTTDAGRWIAVGTGAQGSITPAYSDTELPNEAGRTTIANYQVGSDGTTITFNAFLDQNQANVEDEITRVGVVSTQERLYNHSELTPFEKTGSRGVSLRVTIEFGP